MMSELPNVGPAHPSVASPALSLLSGTEFTWRLGSRGRQCTPRKAEWRPSDHARRCPDGFAMRSANYAPGKACKSLPNRADDLSLHDTTVSERTLYATPLSHERAKSTLFAHSSGSGAGERFLIEHLLTTSRHNHRSRWGLGFISVRAQPFSDTRAALGPRICVCGCCPCSSAFLLCDAACFSANSS
jgi:hypothetical protein